MKKFFIPVMIAALGLCACDTVKRDRNGNKEELWTEVSVFEMQNLIKNCYSSFNFTFVKNGDSFDVKCTDGGQKIISKMGNKASVTASITNSEKLNDEAEKVYIETGYACYDLDQNISYTHFTDSENGNLSEWTDWLTYSNNKMYKYDYYPDYDKPIRHIVEDDAPKMEFVEYAKGDAFECLVEESEYAVETIANVYFGINSLNSEDQFQEHRQFFGCFDVINQYCSKVGGITLIYQCFKSNKNRYKIISSFKKAGTIDADYSNTKKVRGSYDATYSETVIFGTNLIDEVKLDSKLSYNVSLYEDNAVVAGPYNHTYHDVASTTLGSTTNIPPVPTDFIDEELD